MLPTITIGTKTLPMYAVMALIGALTAGLFAYYSADRRGLRPTDMVEVLCIGAIGVVVGSHLLYFLVELPYIGQMSFLNMIGGSVFYGGLLGGIAAGGLWVRYRHYPYGPFADIAGATIPLFHGFARIGCFLGGCCYGIPSSFGFTMTLSDVAGANGVCRFPVQLLESAGEFALFFILRHLLIKRRKEILSRQTVPLCTEAVSAEASRRTEKPGEGNLLDLYLTAYAVIRFLDEFLRGDTLRGIWGPFSTSQWIALAVLAAEGIRLIRRKTEEGKASEKRT